MARARCVKTPFGLRLDVDLTEAEAEECGIKCGGRGGKPGPCPDTGGGVATAPRVSSGGRIPSRPHGNPSLRVMPPPATPSLSPAQIAHPLGSRVTMGSLGAAGTVVNHYGENVHIRWDHDPSGIGDAYHHSRVTKLPNAPTPAAPPKPKPAAPQPTARPQQPSLNEDPHAHLPKPPNVTKPGESTYAKYHQRLQDKFNKIHELAKTGDIAKVEAFKTNGESPMADTRSVHQFKIDTINAMRTRAGRPTIAPVVGPAPKTNPMERKLEGMQVGNAPTSAEISRSRLMQKMGLTDPNKIPLLAGAPSHSRVLSTLSKDGTQLTIQVHSIDRNLSGVPKWTQTRTITLKSNGDVVCHNDYFKIRRDVRSSGIGAEIFNNQVQALAHVGVKEIETHAAGNGGDLARTNAHNAEAERTGGIPRDTFNGFYTWPRFGYTSAIPRHLVARTQAAGFPNATRVEHLMKSPEGRKWWQTNGDDLGHAKFDLREGSLSRITLEAYLSEIKSKKE